MTRTLYLHIGSHKTGTTSIQNFLADNAAKLGERGYAYAVGSNNLNLGGGLGRLDTGETEGSSSGGPIGRRGRLAVETMVNANAPTVIASSEGFSYVFDKAAVELFEKLLRRSFKTIKIITYLRRQDLFAISHHQEGANPQNKPASKMHGHRPTALPQTNELQFKYLDYATRIGMWGDVFGDENMIVRVYDRAALKSGDSVADFLDVVQLGDLQIGTQPAKNVSMGFHKAKIGHILNETITEQQVKAAILARLPDEGKFLPRRDDARRFVEPFVPGNRALNRRFAINGTDGLFPDDYSMFPEEGNEAWSESTADTAIRACAHLIQSMAAGTLAFTVDEYLAAAKALEKSKPAVAKRFMDAAMGLRPESDRLKVRAEKLEKKRAKRASTNDEPATKPAKAKRAAKSGGLRNKG